MSSSIDVGMLEMVEQQLLELENQVKHLQRSNLEMKEFLKENGEDVDLVVAIRENLVVMDRHRKQVEELKKIKEEHQRALRGMAEDTPREAFPSTPPATREGSGSGHLLGMQPELAPSPELPSTAMQARAEDQPRATLVRSRLSPSIGLPMDPKGAMGREEMDRILHQSTTGAGGTPVRRMDDAAAPRAQASTGPAAGGGGGGGQAKDGIGGSSGGEAVEFAEERLQKLGIGGLPPAGSGEGSGTGSILL